MNSGNKIELFQYQVFGANITQIAEGTVGSGITPTLLTNTTTLGQYGDYLSLSDYSIQTAIDDALGSLRYEIAYRAALSLNTVHRNVVDTGATIDSSVNSLSKAFNSNLARSDLVNVGGALLGRGVKPFFKAENRLGAIIHPFQISDMLTDTTSGGVTDIAKFKTVRGENNDGLYELPDEDGMDILDVSGMKVYPSQIVTQTTNYKGNAGVTAYRSYYFGENATFGISLGGKEGAKIGEGDWRNITTVLAKNPPVTQADPIGVIGGWTGYNLKYAASLGTDVTLRYRYIDAPSNVS
jgi:N4-gp56 family major capsid protein